MSLGSKFVCIVDDPHQVSIVCGQYLRRRHCASFFNLKELFQRLSTRNQDPHSIR
jgi:hypothetical protein